MKLDYQYEANRIFAKDTDGRLLAEIKFPASGRGRVDFTSTFVDPSLRGQGIADQMVRAAIAEIRRQGAKAVATCPYVKVWFDRHPEESDLLTDAGNPAKG
jgi:predicted GNAT family acetyltransferase